MGLKSQMSTAASHSGHTKSCEQLLQIMMQQLSWPVHRGLWQNRCCLGLNTSELVINLITKWRTEILPGCPGTVVAFVAGIEGLTGCSQDYQGCTDVAEVWFAGLGHGFIAELCPLMFFP